MTLSSGALNVAAVPSTIIAAFGAIAGQRSDNASCHVEGARAMAQVILDDKQVGAIGRQCRWC